MTLHCFHCSTRVYAFQGHIVLFSSWEYSAGRSTCLKKCSSVRARAKLNLLMRSRKIVNHCDILGHQPIASPPHTTRALCVQMDFTRTFETTTKCNNINHVWSHFYKILVVLKYHRRLWANIFDTDICRSINIPKKPKYTTLM